MPSTHTSIQLENVRLRNLYWYLPQAPKAMELCQTYYRLGAWMSVHFFYREIQIQKNFPPGTIP